MNLRIPTSFRLGGHTWRIRFRKLTGCYGECDYDNHVIYISTHAHGKPTTAETRFQTFIHEALHAVEYSLGRDTDEQMVAGMEQMIYQLFKTAKWKQ